MGTNKYPNSENKMADSNIFDAEVRNKEHGCDERNMLLLLLLLLLLLWPVTKEKRRAELSVLLGRRSRPRLRPYH